MEYDLHTKDPPHVTFGEEELPRIVAMETNDVNWSIENYGWCGTYIPEANPDGSDARCVIVESGDALPPEALAYLHH
jgi:hypothetical protein